ncbi:MAG: RNA polymerase factor sigma-54 [Tissierellia bacterium]|nr:RNA polymerase factor sigma-54 [Tissierellia bacterium]
MRQGMQLITEQRQELILSPQLKQSIEILRFSMEDLVEFLKEESLENPMMELEESDTSPSIEEGLRGNMEREELLEYVNRNDYSMPYSSVQAEDSDYSFLNFTSMSSTLKEDLLFQLNTLHIGYMERLIGAEIIDHLDENGYLRTPPARIAHDMGVSEEDVREVLEIIWTFEPKGVASENLRDCLLHQIGPEDEMLRVLIEEHLEDIAFNRMNLISKKLGIPLEELLGYVGQIKMLDPKPGSSYADNQPVKYITPDATIDKVDGEYQIIMHDEYLPQIHISENYRKMILAGDEETVKFLSKKLNSAEWIISSIQQRKSTILRILEVIVRNQRGFLDHGKRYLAPMSQKAVAEELELHESTISRATTDKYVDTPQGILELKYFFSSELSTDFGTEVSSKAIMAMIEEIIQAENKKRPLSDAKITDMLNAKGIDISRRTVAKYRENLGIQKSSMRKEYI